MIVWVGVYILITAVNIALHFVEGDSKSKWWICPGFWFILAILGSIALAKTSTFENHGVQLVVFYMLLLSVPGIAVLWFFKHPGPVLSRLLPLAYIPGLLFLYFVGYMSITKQFI